MTDKRQFLLGLFVGVVGGLAPDIVSAAQTLRQKPDYALHVYLSYAALILAVVIIYTEVA